MMLREMAPELIRVGNSEYLQSRLARDVKAHFFTVLLVFPQSTIEHKQTMHKMKAQLPSRWSER